MTTEPRSASTPADGTDAEATSPALINAESADSGLTDAALPGPTPIITAVNLRKIFSSGGLLRHRSETRAVDDVSVTIEQGASLGLVGESGSGKTTLGRMIAKLVVPTDGSVLFHGRDISTMDRADELEFRRKVQIIFQNSQNVFNPRRTIRSTLSDPFEIHRTASGDEREATLRELMEVVGLAPAMLDRFPHQLSGGQRQRIGIAKALILQPELLVADEPVSALDVSVQAQVLNLFAALRRDLGVALVFISHDMRAVYFMCETIAVLYLGQIVELAPREVLLQQPAHPYTQALIGSVPAFAPGEGFQRVVLGGEIDDGAPSAGCSFAPRCPVRQSLGAPARCVEERPVLSDTASGSRVACHFVDESLELQALSESRGAVARTRETVERASGRRQHE